MKRISIFILGAMLATAGYSQQFAVGLKGGLNFPTVDALGIDDGIQLSDREGASGYHIGAFTRFKFSKIGIQPELLYSFQSFEFNVEDVSSTDVGTVTQNISYLTVPVMLRLYLAAGLNLQVGPQFGFFLNGDNTVEGISADLVDDPTATLKGTDIGINIGAGWDLPFGLDIHARYTIGVQDVSETTNEAKNSMIQLSIGYALVNLGK
jgi:hypothetical protein